MDVVRELEYWAQSNLRARALLGALVRGSATRDLTAPMVFAAERLVKDLRIAAGEPVPPTVGWPHKRLPQTVAEAQMWLQRPELFDTEMYEAMLRHCPGMRRNVGDLDRGRHADAPELRRFAQRVIQLAQARRVPLFAERMHVEPAVQAQAYVTGDTDIAPSDSPACHGRAVLFGHAAETFWPPACLEWLHSVVTLAARDMNVAIGWSASRPCEYVVADEDGVIIDYSTGPVSVSGSDGSIPADYVHLMDRPAKAAASPVEAD